MKNFICAQSFCCLLLFLASCSKPGDVNLVSPATNIEYVIPKGQHYSLQSAVINTDYTKLQFRVRFDSSAIYSTIDPGNQADINKLYGFSDNESLHHEFSARMGWVWDNNALGLYAYVYNNGRVSSQFITNVDLGVTNSCSISIEKTQYIFKVNDNIIPMLRESAGSTAKGYKLFPYFGGDETAPHDIHIWIEEEQ